MKETLKIGEQDLINYIEGKLDYDQQHDIEVILESDPFLNDAVEGLASLKDEATIKLLTQEINTALKKHIKQKRNKRHAKSKPENKWSWIFVVVILIIVLCVWWVLYYMVNK